jgi:glycosyltransferase involved in cell wall biosynthesis
MRPPLPVEVALAGASTRRADTMAAWDAAMMPRRIQMADDRIAVVVPAFNREAVLGRALESVLSQSCPPQEIVVVDDGSTDGTAAVAGRYGVRVLHQVNRGAAAARNAGVAATSANWIAFLDSDDEWDLGYLERMTQALHHTGGTASLYFADTLRAVPGRQCSSHWDDAGFRPLGLLDCRDRGVRWVEKAIHPMMVQSSVVSRAALRRVGGFREDLRTREDTHLLLALCASEPVCAVTGWGALMHDDATARIGERRGRHSQEYWRCSVVLYADLDRRFGSTAGAGRVFRSRLADAHVNLAAEAFGSGAPWTALGELLRAGRVDPALLAARMSAMVVRRTRAALGLRKVDR